MISYFATDSYVLLLRFVIVQNRNITRFRNKKVPHMGDMDTLIFDNLRLTR